tara:strand:+ start:787 stop:987 length:201 start_codon:yes stop_codon:yes gene_type:complete
MKKTLLILATLLLVGCSGAKYNAVSFGKKCVATAEDGTTRVTHSYVWFYNKDSGLHANQEDCATLD